MSQPFDPLFVAGTKYQGEWVPDAVIVKALYGTLANLVTPNQFKVAAHPPNPHVRCIDNWFISYTVRKESDKPLVLRAIGNSKRLVAPGTIIPVSMREYPVTMGNKSIVLMRGIADGPYDGLWLISHGNTVFSL